MDKPKTVDQIISTIELNLRHIDEIQEQNKTLLKNLRERPAEDFDWISVSTACKMWDISPAKMYDRIARGDIKVRKFDSKMYVSLTDVKNIDDKVGA